jgi:hypothetical protein
MTQLGATYRDKITGFQGVATGYVQYITGCNQVLIAPKANDGGSAMKTPEWLDEQRLDVVPNEPVIVLDNGASPGFDRSAPRR